MPRMSAMQSPGLAEEVLRRVEQNGKQAPDFPDVVESTGMVFELCAEFEQDNGEWTREFEVRELTGRDEEILGRIIEPGKLFTGLLERGMVRVGNEKASPAVIDQLVAGDWETALVAIRKVTFGAEVDIDTACNTCRRPYTVTVNLDDLERRTVDKAGLSYEVIGRKGTVYTVTHPYGSTQRKIMAKQDKSAAELNSLLLMDCIQEVNGIPLLGMEAVLNLPMSDRRLLIKEIDSRRVGPLLGEVKTGCPHCGVEQETPLGVAALFR